MPDIATAYVHVVPSAEGVKKNLETVMSGAGDDGGNAFNSAFGSVVKKIATSAVIITAAKEIVGVFQSAISNASQYEQLVGGIETLFGSAAETVGEYAKNAYKTAGMSANDYMSTATSFAASLKQSFGDAENAELMAAESANRAIQDMADNANKMGTPMESIMNAYQGFSKQNYTMLDNLKLGYGGTKTEMERLLADATKLTGVEYDISSLADVYDAIHVIQQNLGITGTTALEAADTMSGSFATMGAAWQNVLTAMGGGGDLSDAIASFAGSAQGVVKNITPMLTAVFQGIVQVAGTLVPQLAVIVPQLVDVLLQNMPLLIEGAVQLLLGIIDALPVIIPQIVEAIPSLVSAIAVGLGQCIPALISAGVQLFMSLSMSLQQVSIDLVFAVGDFIVSLIDGIATYGAQMVEAGKNFFLGFADGMESIVTHVIEKAKEFCSKLIDAVKKFLGIASPSKVARGIGEYFGEGFAIGMDSTEGMVANSATRLAAAATGSIGSPWAASGVAGHTMTQINITAKELSKQDIDYVVGYANKRLGVMA